MNSKILQEYKDFVWGRHSKRNTRFTYTDHARVMLRWIGKPLDEVNQNDVDRFVQYCLENKKVNGNSIRFWSIRQFLKWAKREDLVLPKINPVDAGKLALNEDEVAKLLNTIETLSPLHRLVFYLEFDAIRRPSEIRKLKLTDRYRDMLSYDGKTGIRPVVMTERLQKAWDDYLQVRPIPATEEDSKYMVLCNYGQYKGRHYNFNNGIDRIIKEVCMMSRIEIPQGETASNYLIKRTTITYQLKDCPDPKIVMQQAGHTKLSTTMKYNRIDEKHIKEYLDIFEHKSANINGNEDISKRRKLL